MADSNLVGKRAKQGAELSMAAHAPLRKLAKGYGRSCKVFHCRPLGETGSRLVALLVDAFESPKISAELALYDRHDLGGKWMSCIAFADSSTVLRSSTSSALVSRRCSAPSSCMIARSVNLCSFFRACAWAAIKLIDKTAAQNSAAVISLSPFSPRITMLHSKLPEKPGGLKPSTKPFV